MVDGELSTHLRLDTTEQQHNPRHNDLHLSISEASDFWSPDAADLHKDIQRRN